jgi:hypothetical protein
MAFSIMLLNTDLHSPQIKRKMTKQEFMYNNTHIHESINLSEELLASIYDRIQVRRRRPCSVPASGRTALVARPTNARPVPRARVPAHRRSCALCARRRRS